MGGAHLLLRPCEVLAPLRRELHEGVELGPRPDHRAVEARHGDLEALEEGRVKPSNAGAVFEILTAAVEDPTRWRKPAMRAAFRRLFCAADARLVLFAMPQQQVMPACAWESR